MTLASHILKGMVTISILLKYLTFKELYEVPILEGTW